MTPRGLKKKIRVFFLIGKLGGGGAERVVLRLLRSIDRGRFAPFLVVLEKTGVFLSEIPPDIPVLDCRRRMREGAGLRWLFNFAGFIRRERPDVIVGFMWFANVIALVGRFLSLASCKVVLSERITVVGSSEGTLTEAVRRASILTVYRFADRIVPNSRSLGKQLVRRFRLRETMVTPIPNPVDIETVRAQSAESVGEEVPSDLPIILGVGRLSHQKGFDLLIRSVKICKTPVLLVLMGEGNEEENLRILADSINVSGRVRIVGFLKNPFPLLRAASIFVLPSRYEGFPNALVEAMALGLPCIATRCPTGPEEIITDGVDGLLVPVEDPGSLATAIDRLLSDESLRRRLGEAARKRVVEFDAPLITRRYETMLEEVTA